MASNDRGGEPDVVMACAGDVPTLETLAAVHRVRRDFPALKVRVVNVVDLMTLQPASEHPHGLRSKRGVPRTSWLVSCCCTKEDRRRVEDRPVDADARRRQWTWHRRTS